MSLLIRSLMLITMLLHSLFGCGWHQIHCCVSGCITVGSACGEKNAEREVAVSKAGCCRSHATHACASRVAQQASESVPHENSEPSGHEHHDDCEHSACSFVASAPADVSAEFSADWLRYCVLKEVPQKMARSLPAGVDESFSLPRSAPAFCAEIQVWRL